MYLLYYVVIEYQYDIVLTSPMMEFVSISYHPRGSSWTTPRNATGKLKLGSGVGCGNLAPAKLTAKELSTRSDMAW